MLHIEYDTWKSLPFDVAAEVAAFMTEVEAHKLTVGVPAPSAVHPLIERVVHVHGGEFELGPEPEPEPEPEPVPPPHFITRRQCARELFNRKMITGPEMVAMTATGTPPAMIEEMFALMPENEQWIARSDFAADTYERNNPLLVGIMTASGSTADDIDEFFRVAAEQ